MPLSCILVNIAYFGGHFEYLPLGHFLFWERSGCLLGSYKEPKKRLVWFSPVGVQRDPIIILIYNISDYATFCFTDSAMCLGLHLFTNVDVL